MNEQLVTWKYECGKDTVTFQFDMEGETVKDMFFRWVQFMNAIGYSLNHTEMFDMWHGVEQ